MRVTHTIIPDGSTFQYKGLKYHVVTHFFDNATQRIVYLLRYYGKYKQWWHYEAWDAQEIDLKLEFELIKIKRKRIK